MAKRHVRQCAKKLVEEAAEFAIEAIDEESTENDLIVEAADVVVRYKELLDAKHIPIQRVMEELKRRGGATGFARKIGSIKPKRKRRRR